MQLPNEKDYKHLLGSSEKIEGFEIIIWFFCLLPVACARSLIREKDIQALILKCQWKICSLSPVTPGELCNNGVLGQCKSSKLSLLFKEQLTSAHLSDIKFLYFWWGNKQFQMPRRIFIEDGYIWNKSFVNCRIRCNKCDHKGQACSS